MNFSHILLAVKFEIKCFMYCILGGNLQLIKDIFKKTKPGLSSYADNPDKVSQKIFAS